MKNYFIMVAYHLDVGQLGESIKGRAWKECMRKSMASHPSYVEFLKSNLGSFPLFHSLGPRLFHHPWTHSHCPVCSLATLEVKGGLGSDTVNQRSQPTCIPASLLGISVVVHLVVFIIFSCWLYQFDMVKIGNYLKSTFLFLCPWKPIFLVIRVNIWSLYKLRWCRMWKEEFENHPFVYITLQLLKIWQYHNIPNIMGIFSCKNICIHSITRNSVIYCSTGIIP